jgi:hypothetical protein
MNTNVQPVKRVLVALKLPTTTADLVMTAKGSSRRWPPTRTAAGNDLERGEVRVSNTVVLGAGVNG